MRTILFAFFLFIPRFFYAQDSWTQKADFGGAARMYTLGFSIGTKGYLGTGIDNATGAYYGDIWEYDPVLNSWSQKASIPSGGICCAVAFVIDSLAYVTVGWKGTGVTDCWEFHPSTNTWVQKQSFPLINGRDGGAGFSIGNKGYMGTGHAGLYMKDFWEYDPQADAWTQKADFGGTSRGAAVGFSIGQKGYLGMGNNNTQFNADLWEYNPVTNAWTLASGFTAPGRQLPAVFCIGARAFFVGGRDLAYNTYNDCREWDQPSNTWTLRAALPSATRWAGAAFSIGGKGYMGTGHVAGKDFWEYTPVNSSVQEIDLSQLMDVYPNPSSGRFTMSSEKVRGDLVIYTMAGECVFVGQLSAFRQLIDLSAQPMGTYLARVSTPSGTAFKKIIITSGK